MSLLDIFLSAFILIIVVSFDVFGIGLAYGAQKKSVPLLHLLIISTIGSILIGGALIFGYYTRSFLNPNITMWASFTLFMLIGLFKLASWFANRNKEFQSKQISIKEAVLLALILAIDGTGIAFAIALETINIYFIIAIISISLVTDIVLFKFGQIIGKTVANKSRFNIGFIGGLLLILIAVLQLVI
ncbi:MAG: manganese efflux pump [Firmicutes bacterium]|nr:manganese efflux pump [Bacillota bacterium]